MMMFFGILFWLFLLMVGVMGLRGFRMHPPGHHPLTGRGISPEEILKMRYARGEITREEFEQMWRDLRRA